MLDPWNEKSALVREDKHSDSGDVEFNMATIFIYTDIAKLANTADQNLIF